MIAMLGRLVIVDSFSKLESSSDKSETSTPLGSVPVAVAWLVTLPLSISVCVIAYVKLYVQTSSVCRMLSRLVSPESGPVIGLPLLRSGSVT